MRRIVPIVLVVGVLSLLGLLRMRGAPMNEPAPATAPAVSATAAAESTAAAPMPRELPGGLVERAQALLPRGDTTVEAGTPAGTLLVTGLAPAGTDPVDAWRRPLHEMRELFVGLPGMLGLEYDLRVGDRKATLHVTRAVAERMQLVKQLDQMHGRREGLLAEKSAGKLDEAAYAAKVRELERTAFSDMLVLIPPEARQIDPELQIR